MFIPQNVKGGKEQGKDTVVTLLLGTTEKKINLEQAMIRDIIELIK